MPKLSHVLDGFFTTDAGAVLAAVAAMASGAVAARSFGAVTSTDTFTRRRGSDRLIFAKRGLFCEVTFGPATDFACACGAVSGEGHAGTSCERCGVLCASSALRGERFGHVDVLGAVHPAVFSNLSGVVGLFAEELRAVAQQDLFLRAGKPVPRAFAEAGDMTGAAAIAALLREVDPAHPLLPLCALRRIPVPPPSARPFVRGLSATMVDPWIGPVNHAWLELVRRAVREGRLQELGAPADILAGETRLVQQAFGEVFAASQPLAPLVPALTHCPEELAEDDALALAFVRDDVLVVQRAEAVFVVSTRGDVRHELPPCGCSLRGVLRDRIAVFEGFFAATHPSLAADPSFGADFVHEDENGTRQIAPLFGELSALDCDEGRYLVEVPEGLPRGAVENGEPEDLFFVDPRSGRSHRLHVGGDRPEALARTRDLQLAWIGEEGASTQVIDLTTGIPHVHPAEPREGEEVLDLRPSGGEEEEAEEGYGRAVAFRDGAWHFLWSHGLLSDQRGGSALRIVPEPRAAAFDSSGGRLAVVVGSEIVLIDLPTRTVLHRFDLPTSSRYRPGTVD